MDSKPEFDLPVRFVSTHQERAQVGDFGRKSAITEAEASLRSFLEQNQRNSQWKLVILTRRDGDFGAKYVESSFCDALYYPRSVERL